MNKKAVMVKTEALGCTVDIDYGERGIQSITIDAPEGYRFDLNSVHCLVVDAGYYGYASAKTLWKEVWEDIKGYTKLETCSCEDCKGD